uniref:Uncharacterized protein n=1 Tax=Amorphochlora amoebiformis TaxID=1561963 RepID=A0A0H5BKQ3_9EUKA|nr:hypothetical protein [Amorphochlora amoebiformis]
MSTINYTTFKFSFDALNVCEVRKSYVNAYNNNTLINNNVKETNKMYLKTNITIYYNKSILNYKRRKFLNKFDSIKKISLKSLKFEERNRTIGKTFQNYFFNSEIFLKWSFEENLNLLNNNNVNIISNFYHEIKFYDVNLNNEFIY